VPYELPPIRPPSEAYSLLVRVMRGCPWNYCTFCAVYKGYPRKDIIRSVAEVKDDIDELRIAVDGMHRRGYEGEPRTAFLADSNAIVIKTEDLIEIVRYLYQVFPSLERLTSYARAKTVLNKKAGELRQLREAGLTRLHVGLESGDDEVLRRVKKGATAREMIEAGKWDEYAAGEFEPLSRYEVLAEIGTLMERLDVTSRVCFDHHANPPIFRLDWEGYKFPEEKATVLGVIERAVEAIKQAIESKGTSAKDRD